MTMGPAPMMRIDLMSVRLGILCLLGCRDGQEWTQKKGALSRAFYRSAPGSPARAKAV
jgi:hypothetical protein